jgi:hypothetical protein
MTKLSIYNTELRLQKLEETACDLVDHVNNLTSTLKQFLLKSEQIEESRKLEKEKLIVDDELSTENVQMAANLKSTQRSNSSGNKKNLFIS